MKTKVFFSLMSVIFLVLSSCSVFGQGPGGAPTHRDESYKDDIYYFFHEVFKSDETIDRKWLNQFLKDQINDGLERDFLIGKYDNYGRYNFNHPYDFKIDNIRGYKGGNNILLTKDFQNMLFIHNFNNSGWSITFVKEGIKGETVLLNKENLVKSIEGLTKRERLDRPVKSTGRSTYTKMTNRPTR